MNTRILDRLMQEPPKWVSQWLDAGGKVETTTATRGKCAAFMGNVVVPEDLSQSTEDLVAFGIAYSLSLDIFRQFAHQTAKAGTLPQGMFRTGREIGEIEARAIEESILWLVRSGFDPNAAGDYFERGFGQIQDRVEPTGLKMKMVSAIIGIALKPLTLAMDSSREGRPAFENNQERIAFARQCARDLER